MKPVWWTALSAALGAIGAILMLNPAYNEAGPAWRVGAIVMLGLGVAILTELCVIAVVKRVRRDLEGRGGEG